MVQKNLIIFLALLWITPQFTAKRSIIPKFRRTNKVNYQQEDEITNSPQSCTSLECSTYRTPRDGKIDIMKWKRDTGIQYKIPSFPNCDNYRMCRASNPNPLNDDTRTNDNELHQQIRGTFKIDYLQEMDIITKVKSRLKCKINVTLLALLPNKIVNDSRGRVISSDKTGQDKLHFRNKRAIPLLAIAQGMAAIGGMLIKGINALVDAKRVNSFNNAIKMLNANVEICYQNT